MGQCLNTTQSSVTLETLGIGEDACQYLLEVLQATQQPKWRRWPSNKEYIQKNVCVCNNRELENRPTRPKILFLLYYKLEIYRAIVE